MASSPDLQIVSSLRKRVPDTDPVALTNFAWFAARRGVMPLALEAVRTAAQHPGAPSATSRALRRLSSGRLDGLILSVPDGLSVCAPRPQLDTTYATIPMAADLLQRGRELLDRNELVAALDTFDQLLHHHPTDTLARFHRGVVLAKLRRYADALQEWERVGRVDRDGPLGAISRRHARSARELATLFTAR